MEQAKAVKISCAGCGRQYRWKPELAGKKVRCGCGHVVEVPLEERPPEPPVEDLEDDLYALAEEKKPSPRAGAVDDSADRCPSCQQAVEVGSVACVNCGFNLMLDQRGAVASASSAPVMMGAGGAIAMVRAVGGAMGGPGSPVLGYAGPSRRAQAAMESGDNKVLDLWVPLTMLAFGLVGSFARLMYFTDEPESFAMSSLIIGLRVCVEVVMLSIGCLIAIKALDVAFGSPGTAALKVAAIAIAPGALSEILSYYLGSTGIGWYAAAIIAALMYFLLFYYLFDLDLGEVLVLSAIVWLIRTWVGMLIVGALLAMFMGGSGGSSTLGSLAAATSANDTTSDEEAEHVMDMGWTWEGKAWINDYGGRILGKMGHAPSVEVVEGFYTAGVEKEGVQIQRDGPAAIMLIVKLPRAKAKRKPIIDYANSIATTHSLATQDDHGQKYLVYHFAP
ncbi:MAG: hypothetical protein H0T11_02020 [Chthoniobacterales bacterium]|nr:hypothetical protein [Chthoniobacterales bacterium]